MNKLRAFWNDEGGATMIEYAIIGTGISIIIVASLTTIGTKVADYLGRTSNGLN